VVQEREKDVIALPRKWTTTRTRTLGIDGFTLAALEELAMGLAVRPSALLRQAVLHFLSEREAGRLTAKVPRFVRQREADGSSVTRTVELELDESDWSALEVEAVAQRVSLETLLEHAALLFIADVDSGRLAVRIAADEEESDDP
jgi:predicted transcriptional regulator